MYQDLCQFYAWVALGDTSESYMAAGNCAKSTIAYHALDEIAIHTHGRRPSGNKIP